LAEGRGGGANRRSGEGGSLASYCGTVDLGAHAGDSPAVAPETVASGLAFPRLVALDEDRVYVADSTYDGLDGTIEAMPRRAEAASRWPPRGSTT